MIQHSKETDERVDAGPLECWCLHGSVGMASDWRAFTKQLSTHGIGSRAVDLWRFLETFPLPLPAFSKALNAEAEAEVFRGSGRALIGYSMGGRMALHALLEENHPWQAAVIISADPGMRNETERANRRASDTDWATLALVGDWQKFIESWEEARSLSGSSPIRDADAPNRLMLRRREVARSFVDWSVGNQESLWHRLCDITVPVLWVAGENDPQYLEIAKRAVAMMPNATLEIIPNAGHRVPWEAGDWLAGRTARFLKMGSL